MSCVNFGLRNIDCIVIAYNGYVFGDRSICANVYLKGSLVPRLAYIGCSTGQQRDVLDYLANLNIKVELEHSKSFSRQLYITFDFHSWVKRTMLF